MPIEDHRIRIHSILVSSPCRVKQRWVVAEQLLLGLGIWNLKEGHDINVVWFPLVVLCYILNKATVYPLEAALTSRRM